MIRRKEERRIDGWSFRYFSRQLLVVSGQSGVRRELVRRESGFSGQSGVRRELVRRESGFSGQSGVRRE